MSDTLTENNSAIIDVPRNGTTEPSLAASVTASEPTPETKVETPKSESRDSRIDEFYRFRAENEVLRREIESLRKPAEPKPVPTEVVTKPKWDPEVYGKAGRSYDDFVEDLADWKANERVAAVEKKSAEVAANRQKEDRIAQFQARIAQSGISDFSEVVQSAPPMISHNMGLIQAAILKNENGPQIVYHFGKNHSELTKFNALPLEEQLAEIAILGREFAKTTKSGNGSVSLPAARSTAPPPVTGVKPSRAVPKAQSSQELLERSPDGSDTDMRAIAELEGIKVARPRFRR